MAILRVQQVWKKRPKYTAPRIYERLDALSPEQRANVRKALDVMRIRQGNWKAVAAAMRLHNMTLMRAMQGRHKPNAALAVRVAQLAGVTVDDVLSGAFPKAGSCPMCGRS